MNMYHSYSFTSLATVFDFGKHKGETLSDVIEREPSYINWCVNNIPEFQLSHRAINEIKDVFPDFIISKKLYEEACVAYEQLYDKTDWLIIDYFKSFMPIEQGACNFSNPYFDDGYEGCYEESQTYERYAGSYAQDVMGYSDEDIDIIFDGDPDAYWNID